MNDQRGTWPRALLALAGSLLFIFTIRWALIEPYVIPSESMWPTLLVHDHIFVNKFAYGLRLPFSRKYILRTAAPQRGDVIVFRSTSDEKIFLVKRVVGLPGEKVEINEDGLYINRVKQEISPLTETQIAQALKDWPSSDRASAQDQFEILSESLPTLSHMVSHTVFRDKFNRAAPSEPIEVPADSYFMAGDNRDHSADSRAWGVLPFDQILGRASVIWLSCEEALAQSGQLCNPQTLRWGRLFKPVR